MKSIPVTFVRIYISESSQLMQKVIHHLKTESKIRGLSVFRAIEGFGESGELSSSIVDLSLDLPITIEFFDDDKAKIENSIQYLNSVIKPGHMVMWEATTFI